MIPIPKGSSSMSDFKNYRGVACCLNCLTYVLYQNNLTVWYPMINNLLINCKLQLCNVFFSVIETVSYYIDHSEDTYVHMEHI